MATESSDVQVQVDEVLRRARSAVTRYRVTAWITGGMLLALCVEMLMKYAFKADVSAIAWIPFAHGWVYVVYLVTVLDLWSKMRWTMGRLVTMVVAGVVPVMSFILEKRIHREAAAKIDAADNALQKRHTAAQ